VSESGPPQDRRQAAWGCPSWVKAAEVQIARVPRLAVGGRPRRTAPLTDTIACPNGGHPVLNP